MHTFKNWLEASEYKDEKTKFLSFLQSIKGLDAKNIDSIRLSDIHKNKKEDVEKIKKYIIGSQVFNKLEPNIKSNILDCFSSMNCTLSRLVRDLSQDI